MDSFLVVDRKESALQESGDILIPIKEGKITAEHIQAELGHLLTNPEILSKRKEGQIAVFKSLGLAIEDVACAEFLFKKAQEKNVSSWIKF